MTAKVDICVLTHNSSEVTRRFLPHLIQTTAGIEYALHLLDNGSDEEGDRNFGLMRNVKANTKPWGNLFRPRYPGLSVTIERSERNLNFAGGNNLLAAKGRAPWICFINNDAFPAKSDWLLRLVAACENGGFLAAGPTSDRVMGYQSMNWNHRLPQIHHIHVLSGFCFLVQREAFEAVGGWDEQFDNGDEDLDLSLAIRNYAWQRFRNPAALVCNRRVFVHHEMSQSLAPWCAKRGETIQQHFKKTHDKLVAKRGERVLLDAFFIEDVKRPYREWAKIGVLPNGTYYRQPADPDSAARQFSGYGETSVVVGGGRGDRAHPGSGNGKNGNRVGGEVAPAEAQGSAAGSEEREGSPAGRGTPSGTGGQVAARSPFDEPIGAQEVSQAHRLRSGGNGRDAAGTRRVANGKQGDPKGAGGHHRGVEADGGAVAGLPDVVHHIGFTLGGGCVHRLEQPGRECCFAKSVTVVRCSCQAEAA